MDGTERPACDPDTGECLCRIGVTGTFCNKCASGYMLGFPACAPCHYCTALWGKDVTDIQHAAQRMQHLIPLHSINVQPGFNHMWQRLLEMQLKLDWLVNLAGRSPTKVEGLENFVLKMWKLKMSIDPNVILIDPSPLLNTEIDNIHRDLNMMLNNFRENIINATVENKEESEEQDDEIKKLHKEFMADEIRVRNATKALELSMDTRQIVKEKLARCTIKGNTGQLEKKFKDLTVAYLIENICGAALHVDCYHSVCEVMLGNTKCGKPNCKGIVSHNAKDTAEQLEGHIKDILNKIQDPNYKVSDAKQMALDTNKLSVDSQNRIKSKIEKLGRETNETKDLFIHIKDYILDDMVLPEEIEKMAIAVLSIQLPGSPDESRTMINKYKSMFSNDSILIEDLKNLENHDKTAKDLLDKAMDLKKRTKNIDVCEITTAISDAQNAQDKAKNLLRDASSNNNMTIKQINYIKKKMNTDDNVKSSSKMDMRNWIGALKNKTEMNQEQAKDVWKSAQSALANSRNAQTKLEDVKDLFDILKEKNSNQTLQDEASMQIKNLTLEAKNMKKQVQDKLGHLSDMEKRIQDLIKRKKDKASEVAKLLEKVESLLIDIDKCADNYISCT